MAILSLFLSVLIYLISVWLRFGFAKSQFRMFVYYFSLSAYCFLLKIVAMSQMSPFLTLYVVLLFNSHSLTCQYKTHHLLPSIRKICVLLGFSPLLSMDMFFSSCYSYTKTKILIFMEKEIFILYLEA